MGGEKKGAATKLSLGGVAPGRSKHTFSDQHFHQNKNKNVDNDYDFRSRVGKSIEMIKIDGTCTLSLILPGMCSNNLEFCF